MPPYAEQTPNLNYLQSDRKARVKFKLNLV